MNKKSWTLSKEDIDTLSSLIEKKNALANLLEIIDDKDMTLKVKAKNEYEKVVSEYKAWWDNMGTLHHCKATVLKVDFDTGELIAEK